MRTREAGKIDGIGYGRESASGFLRSFDASDATSEMRAQAATDKPNVTRRTGSAPQ